MLTIVITINILKIKRHKMLSCLSLISFILNKLNNPAILINLEDNSIVDFNNKALSLYPSVKKSVNFNTLNLIDFDLESFINSNLSYIERENYNIYKLIETDYKFLLIEIKEDIKVLSVDSKNEKDIDKELFRSMITIHQASQNSSLKEVLQITLDEAEKLTNSKIGFYHFIDEEDNIINLQQWSTNTKKYFCKIDEYNLNNIYEISKAGVWADCIQTRKPIIHNNYKTLPNKKVYPVGHAEVLRELVVPVLRNNKIVAILGVGNKETNYNNLDLEIIIKLADLAWDIALLKIHENKINEERDKFKTIFDNAPIAMALARNRMLYDANILLCQLFKINKDDLLLKNTRIFYYSDEGYKKLADLINSLKSGESKSTEVTLKKANEEIFDAIVHISKFSKAEDFYIVSVTDITERKLFEKIIHENIIELKQKSLKLEELLEEKNELISMLAKSEAELKKSNNEKEKFFSIIAHDLRSPFQGLLGLTQILTENIDIIEREDIYNIANNLQNSAKSLYNLLDNLLQFSRVKRGMVKAEFSIYPLIHVISENVELLKSLADNKNISIEYNLDESIYVNVDINLFNAILRNLLTNAIKFSYSGGKIVIKANKSKDGFVEVSIKDNGIGMTYEEQQALFDAGVKFTKKGTMGEPSTGLGLLICKEYVELLGGKIWVKSNLNEGTTFYFNVKSFDNL